MAARRGQARSGDGAESAQLLSSFAADVEAWIARIKQTQALDDAQPNAYRSIAANWTEDQFVEAYAEQILGEQRREPVLLARQPLQPAQPAGGGRQLVRGHGLCRLAGRVTGKAYRLPTEAEWEWAARRSARRYPWGDDWDADALQLARQRPQPSQPGRRLSRTAQPTDGLHELAGNVYEWTMSLYRPYPYRSGDGREDADVDGLRVVQGRFLVHRPQ